VKQNNKKNEDSKRNENVNQKQNVGKNKLFLDFFSPTFKLSLFLTQVYLLWENNQILDTLAAFQNLIWKIAVQQYNQGH